MVGEVGGDRFVPSWVLVVFVVALFPALTQPVRMLNDPDTYLHIAAGRWMIEHLALPLHDPFSHSMPGAIWVPHEWLAETALAAVFAAAGWGGIVALTSFCFALALALMTRYFLARLAPLPSLILIIASYGLLLPHLLARPHVLALPCLVLWAGALFAARDRGAAPPLWVLPVLALWANLHGSFMAGLGLALLLGAEAAIWPAGGVTRRAEIRRWGGFVLLSTAAALLTPNHIEALLQPIRLIAMPTLQASFIEWQSPSLAAFPSLELWVLGALFAGLGCGIKLPVPRLTLVVLLLYLAFQHSRHADLLAVFAPLAIAGALGPQLRVWLPDSGAGCRSSRSANVAALTAATVIVGFVLLRPLARHEDAVSPATALSFVQGASLSGPVFNDESFGGYLAYRGVPVFIDGRIEMYGDAFLAGYIAATNGTAGRLAELLERYHVGWTLLRPDNAAVGILDTLKGWRRVHSDASAVVHARLD